MLAGPQPRPAITGSLAIVAAVTMSASPTAARQVLRDLRRRTPPPERSADARVRLQTAKRASGNSAP